MAPGAIPRNYVTEEKFNELVEQVDRIRDSLIVLADVMKLLTCKVYGDTPDESAEEVFLKTVKMVNSWEKK